jgi:hypothetical protein
MRYLLLSSVLVLAAAATVASAETPAVKRTVCLDHLVLEELKTSNPERYAQVRKVMASASELCRPNAARQWQVANVSAASCSSMLLKTSFPPKRTVGFQIDDTWYVANVIVRDLPALRTGLPDQLIPAGQIQAK